MTSRREPRPLMTTTGWRKPRRLSAEGIRLPVESKTSREARGQTMKKAVVAESAGAIAGYKDSDDGGGHLDGKHRTGDSEASSNRK